MFSEIVPAVQSPGGLRYRKGSVTGKLKRDPDSVSVTDESSSGRLRYRRGSVKGKLQRYPNSVSVSLLYEMKNFSPWSHYIAWIRIIMFVIPSSVDPLTFYIPAINDDKKCLNLHRQLLPTSAFALSLACKIFVVIISLFFMIAHLRDLMFKGRNRRSYQLSSFLIDCLISIPVSEMMLPYFMEEMTGSKLSDAMNFYKLVIFIQYVARIIRIYSFSLRAIRISSKLVEPTWPRVAFNLFLYLQAANVFGGLWYFMAIKRETECWKKACINHTGQSHCSFNCHDSLEDYTFLSELCPTKKRNTTIHDFGIFHGALESGIVEGTNFLQKFLHCFVWGLQNLSNLGQNLQTSRDVRENIFVILVVCSGFMLFALLIGNFQTYLLSRTVRLNEMIKKPREIEEWEPFQKLSKDIQQQVKKYKSYIRRKTNHIDVESLLNNLPKELGRKIKRELCWPLLKKVQECMMLKEETLDALSDHVKPAFFSDHTHILREGDPIDEMIFVVQGKLRTYTFKDITSGTMSSDNKRDDGHTTMKKDHLLDGEFYGEELVDWALRDNFSLDIPKSIRTIQALTNVEAFILMAEDLKIVCIDMMNQAARVIQFAWRQHHTRRLGEREQKNLINELTQGRELAKLLQIQLNKSSSSSHDQARVIQFAWRRYHIRRRIDMMNQAARVIQFAWRRYHTRRQGEREQKNLINEVKLAREQAKQLLILLKTPSVFSSRRRHSFGMLLQNIISSYEKALYMLNFSSSSSSTQDPQLTGQIIESPTSVSMSDWSYQDSEWGVNDPALRFRKLFSRRGDTDPRGLIG